MQDLSCVSARSIFGALVSVRFTIQWWSGWLTSVTKAQSMAYIHIFIYILFTYMHQYTCTYIHRYTIHAVCASVWLCCTEFTSFYAGSWREFLRAAETWQENKVSDSFLRHTDQTQIHAHWLCAAAKSLRKVTVCLGKHTDIHTHWVCSAANCKKNQSHIEKHTCIDTNWSWTHRQG